MVTFDRLSSVVVFFFLQPLPNQFVRYAARPSHSLQRPVGKKKKQREENKIIAGFDKECDPGCEPVVAEHAGLIGFG